jgi:hypothetical protein
MKLITKILQNGTEITRKESDFPNVKDEDEFLLNAPQAYQAVEEVINEVFKQKIEMPKLNNNSVIIYYNVGNDYSSAYIIEGGMTGINASETSPDEYEKI